MWCITCCYLAARVHLGMARGKCAKHKAMAGCPPSNEFYDTSWIYCGLVDSACEFIFEVEKP